MNVVRQVIVGFGIAILLFACVADWREYKSNEEPQRIDRDKDSIDTASQNSTIVDSDTHVVEEQPQKNDVTDEVRVEQQTIDATDETALEDGDIQVSTDGDQANRAPRQNDMDDDITGDIDMQSQMAEVHSASSTHTQIDSNDDRELVHLFCQKISDKLSSVSLEECLLQQLRLSSYWTEEGNALTYKPYPPLNGRKAKGRVLVIGGIHGDEYSAVSIMFKWMTILNKHHSGLFHWKFLPAANPDGLFKKPSQRQNSRGVDLNRNFPSSDWDELAHQYWKEKAYSNKRRYPGVAAVSEIETQWILNVIHSFKPDIIISVHAPYELVDYDGPTDAPKKIGDLHLAQLGVYPGSLGNYVGVDLKKPIVTLELTSAGIMPSKKKTFAMWLDLVRWLMVKMDELNQLNAP